MEFIRRHSNSLLAKIFYFGIAVSFLIGGVSLFGGGSSSDYVAEINGEKISILEVDNLYRELLNTGDFVNFIDKNQDDLTDEDHQILKEQAYDIAESRLLASQLAETLQILTTNQEVAGAIQAIEYFQDSQTGEFEKDRYDNYLRQTYMTPEQFESGVREDLTRQKLLRYIALGVINSESSLEELARIDNASGSFTLLPIHFGEYPVFAPTLSEDEINSFYEAEKETLIADNRVKLSYIHFAKEDFVSRVHIDEKEVKEKVAELESRTFERVEYSLSADLAEEKKEQIFNELFRIRNEFEASSDTSNFKMEEVLKAAGNEGFEYVAGETVNKGDIGDEVFDNVLFNLTLDNPLSDPFETDNGLFLIRLTAVKNILGAGVDANALVREELIETKVEDVYFEAQDQFEHLADELGDDIEAIAKAMELTLEKTDWLSLDKKDGILQENSFFEAIQMLDFSAGETISLPFSPQGDDGALVKIEAYEATHPMSLEEATPLIKDHLSLTQERLAIVEALEEAKPRLEKNEITLTDYAREKDFILKHFTNLSHQDLPLEVRDPFLVDILQEVFFNGAVVGNSYQVVEGSGGFALLYVESYKEGSTNDYTANEREQKRYFLQLEQANYEFNAVFQDFKTRSKIKRLANSFL